VGIYWRLLVVWRHHGNGAVALGEPKKRPA
jgi:hypothetical protein